MSASYATVLEVQALAPELKDASPEQLALVVDDITPPLLSPERWGDRLSQGHQTLAAHFAVLTIKPELATGPVASRTIDKLSESYAVSGIAGGGELSATKYGRMHAALARRQSQSTSFTAPDPFGWRLPDGRVL